MKTVIIALALSAMFATMGWKLGYQVGDREAREDYADLVNECYGDIHEADHRLLTAEDLYGCIISR